MESITFPELNDYTPKGHRRLLLATHPDGASADCAMDDIAIRLTDLAQAKSFRIAFEENCVL